MMKKKKEKRPRISDKDVFLAEKLKDANFNTGFYQVPEIDNADVTKPKSVVLWSKRKQCSNKKETALLFYEYDCRFDGKRGIYNILKYGKDDQIEKLIAELREFAFVVCPDYSVYGDFPNYKQIEALSKSREVGFILSTFGIKVVVNYRTAYPWTYELALSGIPKYAVIAIGTLGAVREKETRIMLREGVDYLIEYLKPRALLIYGPAPQDVFKKAIENAIPLWQFDPAIKGAFERRAM